MEVISHPSREILSSWALQALDPDEGHSVKEHLSTCQECSQLLKEYDAIADGLLFALPPQAPSAELRSRLAASLSGGKSVFVQSHRRFRFSILQAALGAATIILLIATTYLVFQIRYLEQQQAVLLNLLNQEHSSLALVTQPGISIVPFNTNQVTGNVVISPDEQSGVLFLRGLSVLAPELTYQVWLIPANGVPQSVGVFQVSQNQPFVSFPMGMSNPIKNFDDIGITIEPRGGSKTPTTNPILLIKFS